MSFISTGKGSQIHHVNSDVAFPPLPIGARADKNPGPMVGSFNPGVNDKKNWQKRGCWQKKVKKMGEEKRLNHQYVGKMGEYTWTSSRHSVRSLFSFHSHQKRSASMPHSRWANNKDFNSIFKIRQDGRKKKDPYFVKLDRINVGIFTSKHSVSLCNVNFHWRWQIGIWTLISVISWENRLEKRSSKRKFYRKWELMGVKMNNSWNRQCQGELYN